MEGSPVRRGSAGGRAPAARQAEVTPSAAGRSHVSAALKPVGIVDSGPVQVPIAGGRRRATDHRLSAGRRGWSQDQPGGTATRAG